MIARAIIGPEYIEEIKMTCLMFIPRKKRSNSTSHKLVLRDYEYKIVRNHTVLPLH